MRVRQITASFLEWVKSRRSENTFKFYEGRLKAFDAEFGHKKVKKLTIEKIEQHLLRVNHWQDGREKAPDTQRGNIVAFEQWQKFALKHGHIEKLIVQDLEKPLGRRRERLPTAEEVELIKAKSSRAFRLIYQSLRQCGARPNELARATVADWDRDENVIVLLKHKTAKKTGRPRRIYVGEKLQQLLLESLAGRTEGPLFLTPRGLPWTTAALSQAFARARKASGTSGELVLYLARHEHATVMVREKGLEAAADALGHTSLDTTRRYDHKQTSTLRSNQDAVNL